MLPYAAQSRLLSLVPDAYRIDYDIDGTDRTGEYDVDTFWARSDVDPQSGDGDGIDYPVCTLSFSRTGVLVDQEQSLSPVLERRDGDTLDAYEELRGHRVYDEVEVTLATRGFRSETETTAHERLQQFAPAYYRWFSHELPLLVNASGGKAGEVPVTIRPADVSAMTDVSDLRADGEVAAKQFTVTCRYVLATVLDVDRVRGIHVDVGAKSTGGLTRIEVEYAGDDADEVTSDTYRP